MDDSIIRCYEVTDVEETNFNEKKYNLQNLYILLVFLLITMSLLITVSIYCYLKKYQANQKHLLPFHDTNLYG